MRIRYLVKETFDGIRRARFSFILSVFILSFCLLLVGFFTVLSVNIEYFLSLVHSQMQLQAFISNTLEEDQISKLQLGIGKIEGIGEVAFISKDDAAKEFQKEFGKELFNIIDENPLPSSFNIILKEKYRNEADVKRIAELLKNESGIEEVVYHHQTWLKLSRYAKLASTVSLFLLVFSTLGSLFVVANNIRLVIFSRKQVIQTMQLVGATPAFIQLPLIIEGALQGALGGLIASVILYFFGLIMMAQIPGLAIIPSEDNFILTIAGLGFGLTGSLIAIKRYL